jgi:hypothetical protein
MPPEGKHERATGGGRLTAHSSAVLAAADVRPDPDVVASAERQPRTVESAATKLASETMMASRENMLIVYMGRLG